ncbi:MAG: hypothetical protein KAG84_05705 [Bacteroidales bacterium]|nr:hypothetical protein [Bacteroidales bacterium]
MNCNKIQSLSIEFLNKEINEDMIHQIEIHIAECAQCNAYYNFTEKAFQQIHNEKSESSIPNFYEDVISKIHKEEKRFVIPQFIKVGVAAAAIFVAMLGGNFFANYTSTNIEQGFAEAVTEDVIDIDLVDNNFDLFNNF